MKIELPYRWQPRPYQQALWAALEGGCKRAVCLWHRRAGKDNCSMNWTVRESFRRPGLYWHVLPTYKQGRKIVWEGMTREGRPFMDYFPPGSWYRKRDDEMSLWLHGGSLWQVVGTDEPDRLVGANPVGVVMSEYSLQNPIAWQLIRPILVENGGWALFIYTPRGRNHGYRLYKMAQREPDWFAQILTVEDTGVISAEEIEQERRTGMPEELIQQEYFCSFDAPLVGSYFGDLIHSARKDGRITKVAWEPLLPVETAWDLGIGDRTAIWFFQRPRYGLEIRAIDYYEHDGVGMSHYAKILHEKPYAYTDHIGPHDASVRELGTGKSRIETLRDLGIRMRVAPKLSIDDRIQATRALIPKVWFDEERCERGIQALHEYTKQETQERGPEGEIVYRDAPAHNWASHGADALGTYAVAHRAVRREGFKQPDTRYVV